MPSAIDIVNLALSHLGDKANVTAFDERSAQAEAANRFYPHARTQALEAHAWSFADTWVALEAIEDGDTIRPPWLFTYMLPPDCIKPRSVHAQYVTSSSAPPNAFIEVTHKLGAEHVQVIHTNVMSASLVYTRDVTDTGAFTPGFVTALSWLLASYLAGPVTKDIKRRDAALKMYEHQLPRAGAHNANSAVSNAYRDHVPYSVAARR